MKLAALLAGCSVLGVLVAAVTYLGIIEIADGDDRLFHF